MILSTCNRVEIVCSCNETELAIEAVFSLLANHSGLTPHELHERADVF